jgi:hypothetical protein
MAVRTSASGIAIGVWGEVERTEIGCSTVTTTAAVKVASNSMPQLMIRARRRSCFLWVADRGCAGATTGERTMGGLLAFEGASPMGLPANRLKVG